MGDVKRGTLSGKLYWVFGGLLAIIVILVVVVVMVNMNNSQPEEEVALNSGSVSDDILERLDLKDKNIIDREAYYIHGEILDIYNEENAEEALELYDRTIEEAFSHNNFDLFYELVRYRANLLRRESRCDDATRLFDLYDVSNFSIDERIKYYTEARAQFFMCDNIESYEIYEQKINQLLDSKTEGANDAQ